MPRRLSEHLGLRLVEARTRQGLSASALAKAAGVHHKTVQEIELGRRSPTVETIERLALALGVHPCWLAYGGGDEAVRGPRVKKEV